ncbi:hypothetical protein [Sphingomonas aracearum]|uniref:hypothetical protein n=1 Tax=Sphingomonas aracearum TaxID=2283317 RepID=UPI0015F10BD3|nr:hypothetical protein [Sphingomonas aracearum]
MATTPPTELPPQPSQPAQPDAPPPEVGPNAPDVDIPSPQPGGDPTPAQPTN